MNTSIPILPEDKFVCPKRPLTVAHHNRVHTRYIPHERKVLGISVRKGSRVALRAGRRRLFERKIVVKPEGEERSVISLNEYRYVDQFDESAWFIVVGKKAPCTPYPAIRTTQVVRIADGHAHISDLEFKDL